MNILVVGGGGREHAICWALKKSRAKPRIFCAPGNAGTSGIAENVSIAATDIHELLDFAETNKIALTVVGGENSLALGITDEFEKRGLRIIGVSRAAARLEASKTFAKDFMLRHNVPTARYRVAASPEEARQILRSGEFGDEHSPVVVKADGLAAGKGVVVAHNRIEAERAIQNLMIDDSVGKEAAVRVVLEEMLTGREVSLLLFADGRDYRLMPPVRDHKRIGENDTGANTGGMGTITTIDLLDEEQLRRIEREVIEPTLAGAAAEGFPFRGILFLGLMMTANGARVLEYNVRFGDPETQAILVRLETDLVEICEAVVNGELQRTAVNFSRDASACVVLASQGYPAQPRTGDRITGLERTAKIENAVVFHSGTTFDANGEMVTAGGRVLGVTAVGQTLGEALQRSYAAAAEINWNGMQFRRDIGRAVSGEQ